MIKDIAIEKMKSASNYVITFLKWALISIIIGVVGGCVGALFHMSVNYANILFTMHDWFVLFLPIGGIIIVAMYKACKMLENKGTDSIISSIRNDEKVPISLAPLIFVSTVITHLCGGSAGREGAALQLGGSIGSNIGRLFKLDGGCVCTRCDKRGNYVLFGACTVSYVVTGGIFGYKICGT